MTDTNTIKISTLEKMTESEVRTLSLESVTVKGHTIHFVDAGGGFGYSMIVFFGENQIKYANDYELHHPGRNREELRAWYLESANHQLYTDEEISGAVIDYHDYEAKRRYITELVPLRYDHLSMFHIFNNSAEDQEYEQAKQNYPFTCAIAFSYFKESEPVELITKLYKILQEKRKESEQNYDYWFGAFYHELANHEYCINWEGDYDTLSTFGNIEYHGDEQNERELYFEELKFSEMQKKAYMDARRKYLKDAEENGWG